jgi:hypothetical protein
MRAIAGHRSFRTEQEARRPFRVPDRDAPTNAGSESGQPSHTAADAARCWSHARRERGI